MKKVSGRTPPEIGVARSFYGCDTFRMPGDRGRDARDARDPRDARDARDDRDGREGREGRRWGQQEARGPCPHRQGQLGFWLSWSNKPATRLLGGS